MDIGFVTAFLGGALALLSPCAALLLPAFFASTINTGPKLLVHAGVFYMGLLTVLIPIGMGAGAVGSLFVSHRDTLITISSIFLIVVGIAQIFGIGFDVAKLLPGHERVEHRSKSATGLVKTFLLGMTSGVGGFCAGPILGAVLMMAATSGDVVIAGLLLATYGAGMVAPLLIIVALWRPLGQRGRSVLRGHGFSVFGRRFHTTSILTGVLIFATGILFWRTNGLVGLPELVSLNVQATLQETAGSLANPLVDVIAVIAIAVMILVIWYTRRKMPDAAAQARDEKIVDSAGQPASNLISPRGE